MPTDTAYQRQRRREARANRLCGVCCVRPSPNAYRCEHCKTKQKEQPAYNTYEDRAAPDSFCIDCQAHGRHRADCPTQARGRVA